MQGSDTVVILQWYEVVHVCVGDQGWGSHKLTLCVLVHSEKMCLPAHGDIQVLMSPHGAFQSN